MPSVRQADVTIAKVAKANRGIYDVGAHMTQDQGATDSYVETHQRRLEAKGAERFASYIAAVGRNVAKGDALVVQKEADE